MNAEDNFKSSGPVENKRHTNAHQPSPPAQQQRIQSPSPPDSHFPLYLQAFSHPEANVHGDANGLESVTIHHLAGHQGFASTFTVTLTLARSPLEYLSPPFVAVACSLAGSDLNAGTNAQALLPLQWFSTCRWRRQRANNHCDVCGAPSSANWLSMILSKSAGGSAPLKKTPFTKNPGVPATPTLRPCSMSASILDLNLPLLRHD
jgi:hypothetical protein